MTEPPSAEVWLETLRVINGHRVIEWGGYGGSTCFAICECGYRAEGAGPRTRAQAWETHLAQAPPSAEKLAEWERLIETWSGGYISRDAGYQMRSAMAELLREAREAPRLRMELAECMSRATIVVVRDRPPLLLPEDEL